MTDIEFDTAQRNVHPLIKELEQRVKQQYEHSALHTVSVTVKTRKIFGKQALTLLAKYFAENVVFLHENLPADAHVIINAYLDEDRTLYIRQALGNKVIDLLALKAQNYTARHAFVSWEEALSHHVFRAYLECELNKYSNANTSIYILRYHVASRFFQNAVKIHGGLNIECAEHLSQPNFTELMYSLVMRRRRFGFLNETATAIDRMFCYG